MQRCENLSVKGGLVIAREIATQSKHIGPGPIVMASNNFSIVAANVCAVAEFTCKTGLVSKTCNHRNVPLKPLPRQLPLAPSHFCLLSFVASTRISIPSKLPRNTLNPISQTLPSCHGHHLCSLHLSKPQLSCPSCSCPISQKN
jgi:hypothetical protein